MGDNGGGGIERKDGEGGIGRKDEGGGWEIYEGGRGRMEGKRGSRGERMKSKRIVFMRRKLRGILCEYHTCTYVRASCCNGMGSMCGCQPSCPAAYRCT